MEVVTDLFFGEKYSFYRLVDRFNWLVHGVLCFDISGCVLNCTEKPLVLFKSLDVQIFVAMLMCLAWMTTWMTTTMTTTMTTSTTTV